MGFPVDPAAMSSPHRLLLPDQRIVELHASCSLGRAPDNDVRLADEYVGRRHAIIQVQKNEDGGSWEFRLVDLGSSNGTMLNGRRISRPVALKHGDVIEMGGSRIVFQSDAPSGHESPDSDSLGSTLIRVVRRSCWLMVADIAGSTRMARELPPEQVPRVTGGWFKECREMIERHDGHMNQYLGDGFFCYWEDSTDAGERVLGAMRDLARLQERSTLEFRVVVHRGMTVLGSVPTLTSLNLHGPAVNFVFRMEKLAASWRDSRLCSEDAWLGLGVKSLARRESEVGGYDGIFAFHVPDLS